MSLVHSPFPFTEMVYVRVYAFDKTIHMLRILLSLILMSGWFIASGQQIQIIDADTREPLSFVTIQTADQSWSGVSDEEGMVDMPNVQPDASLEFRRIGYETLRLTLDELQAYGFQVKMNSTGIELDQIVVSATRWKQDRNRVAARIRSVDPETVQLQNPQTAADLLGLTGEVFIQKSQQGGGSPMIRGFATNRLLYTIDGVRMNTAIFRGGNIQNVINLDPFAIEQTEVLFGPGSVIYGSDAIGGVMSFQTMEPKVSGSDTPLVSGSATGRYASANREQTGHLDVNVGWEKWAFSTSLSSWQYGHLRQGQHGPDDYVKPIHVRRFSGVDEIVTQEDPLLQIPSAYDQVNLLQKVRFRPNDEWNLEYGFHFSETTPYGRYDRHNRTRNGNPRYAEWNYGPQMWMMNHLKIEYRGNSPFYDDVQLSLAHQAFEESRIDRDFNQPQRRSRTEEVNAYSLNLDFIKNTGERNLLFYGLEYVKNDVRSSGTLEDIVQGTVAGTSSRYPDAAWRSLAAYVNNEFRWSKQWTLQAGVRYNRFTLDADFRDNQEYFPLPFEEASLANNALTGSLGAVFRPSSKWVIRVNAGTAFRAPNADDVGKIFDSEPGAVVVPNADLEAEQAYNLDLGVATTIGRGINLDITAYYTSLQNAMVRRNFTLNGQDSILYDGTLSQVQAIQNAAKANVYGLQFSMNIDLPRGFAFRTNLNVQHGEEELDDGRVSPSRHAAPFFGVSRLMYEAGLLRMEAYLQFQGERSFEDLAVDERGKDEIYAKDDQGRNFAPAWYTLNVKAQYQVSEAFSLSGGLENITDQRYRPYSSGLSGPGRNFILAANVAF